MEKILKNIKAIIFDMDGTIIDTEQLWQKASARFLHAQGYTTFSHEDQKNMESLSGIAMTPSAARLKMLYNLPQTVDEIAKETQQMGLDLFRTEGLKFVNGFEDFHRTLKTAQMPTAIATNAEDSGIAQLKEQLSLDQFFGNHIYGISSVGHKPKPDPALFLHVADRLGVLPSECIIFEDSHAGFTAAQEAGIRCIAIKNKLNGDLLHKVDGAIEHYGQAIETLRRLISDT